MYHRPQTINLAIDANEANVKHRVGSGQYAFNLIRHWHSQTKYNFHLFLKESPVSNMPAVASHWHYHLVKPNRFWLKFSLPFYLRTHRFDFRSFFSPAHYSPPFLKMPLVVTVHDLAYEYFPDQFLKKDLYKLRRWTLASLKQAKKVIAVSQNTKRDLIKLYQLPASKIAVVYNGYDKAKFNAKVKPDPLIWQKYHLPKEPFILYLGTIQPRKNVLALVKSFHQLKKRKQYGGKLVLAGNFGWLSEPIIAKIKNSPLAQDIYLPGYIDSADLASLYKLADLYVLPSLYEGFGLPVLEAMACGTPVVVANNSSLPEVAGQAGVYFQASNPQSLYQALLQAFAQTSELKRKGYLQVRKFSWQKTANQTLKILLNPENSYN